MHKKSIFTIFLTLCLVILWITLFYSLRDRNENVTANNEVNIGAILPLSGNASQYGIWIREALDLALNEVNQKGGINGNDLKIVYEDDKANPKLASQAMQKLVSNNKVPIVFGSWASSSVLAQAPIANESKVVVMGEAVSPKIRDAGDFVFRIQPDGSVYLKNLIPFVVKNFSYKTALIIYVNNDFGVDLANTADTLMQSSGIKIIDKQAFAQDETNFRTQLTIAKSLNPDAIFVFAYAEAGHILKQARELGITSPFFAAATFENPNILKIAGDAAEGVIYPHHFNPESKVPIVEAYQKKYKEHYGRLSEGFAALAYDGILIVTKALKQCNNDGSCIRDYLYKMEAFVGVTGTTSFDDHGDVIKPIIIKTVKNGQFVTLN